MHEPIKIDCGCVRILNAVDTVIEMASSMKTSATKDSSNREASLVRLFNGAELSDEEYGYFSCPREALNAHVETYIAPHVGGGACSLTAQSLGL